MWDLSMLGIVPGMRVAVPRAAATLRAELAEALAIDDGPTALRFPKGAVAADVPAVDNIGGVDVLRAVDGARNGAGGDVLIVAVGPFAELALETAQRLQQQGIEAAVVDPRWVLPVPRALVDYAANFRLVVTVEDNGVHGGAGAAVSAALRAADNNVPSREVGVPQRFLEHGSRDQVLRELGLTAQDVALRITGWVAGLDAGTSSAQPSQDADITG
jgi:1-deoxy-D-xylulose-5-phosphate synthase